MFVPHLREPAAAEAVMLDELAVEGRDGRIITGEAEVVAVRGACEVRDEHGWRLQIGSLRQQLTKSQHALRALMC